MRFRLAELLMVLAVLAFAIASLQRADPLFEMLFYSFTLLFVLVALLLAIGRRGGSRAYWLGFGMTSSLYLVLAHTADHDGRVPRQDGPEITTQCLRLIYNAMHKDVYDSAFSRQTVNFFSVQDETGELSNDNSADPLGDESNFLPQDDPSFGIDWQSFPAAISPSPTSGVQPFILPGNLTAFMRIGHCAWALSLGWLAAHVTQFAYERGRRPATAG